MGFDTSVRDMTHHHGVNCNRLVQRASKVLVLAVFMLLQLFQPLQESCPLPLCCGLSIVSLTPYLDLAQQ